MNAIFTILTVLILIAAVLLILVVLLQSGKGEGMASNFVAGNQTFGVRQTADILEKITWGLVAFIIVLSVVASFTTGTTGADLDMTDKIETVGQEETTPEFTATPLEGEENPATPGAPATEE